MTIDDNVLQTSTETELGVAEQNERTARQQLQRHYQIGCGLCFAMGCVASAAYANARYSAVTDPLVDDLRDGASMTGCVVAGMTVLAMLGYFVLYWNDARKMLKSEHRIATEVLNAVRQAPNKPIPQDTPR